MMDQNVLVSKLRSLNAKDYGAYQSLKGLYHFPGFQLSVDQIPKDPYAPPHTGLYRILIKNHFTSKQKGLFNSSISVVAFCDFLNRCFFQTASGIAKMPRGTGYSGIITIAEPSQAVLRRNAVMAEPENLEIRFFMGLAANGRKINASLTENMFTDELPRIIDQSLNPANIDMDALEKHINTVEDAEALRSGLDSLGLICFVANASILPRASGISDKPMDKDTAVPFQSPANLEVEIVTPHSGRIKGMGIAKGISLIVGGGYHGKSTLLKALEQGIYNHIPGDGREKCVTDKSAIKIRSYSGRNIQKVNISWFINNLPFGKSTKDFTSANASGSTSQAASIIESVEMGTKALLMDEDTCATNFMIRDRKMQDLVSKKDEPITTFIDRVQELYREQGISSIIVLGGVGDYFDVADLVIQMKNYLPLDKTEEAREISEKSPLKREMETNADKLKILPRVPEKGSINPLNKYNKKSLYAKEVNRIYIGEYIIDLNDLEQLVELNQTKALAQALITLQKTLEDKLSIKKKLDILHKKIKEQGLDLLCPQKNVPMAEFRPIDLAFALNRLPSLKIE